MTRKPGPVGTPFPTAEVAPRRAGIDLSDLLPRVLSAIVMIAVAIGTAVAGGSAFAVLWWVAALAIHWECQRLIGSGRNLGRLLIGAAAITSADLALAFAHPAWAVLLLAAGAGVVALAGPARRRLSAAGVIYAAALPIALGMLRSGDHGLEAVLWLFAVVWGTDVMAYFGGRLIGGPKLWPRVSPSKTWSGFLIGVGSGALVGLLVTTAWQAAWPLLPLGLAAGTLAQGGDLFESGLKRRFGVKDSSRLIPGHGGVMDRLDGFLTAAVFSALFGMLRFGVEGTSAGLMQW